METRNIGVVFILCIVPGPIGGSRGECLVAAEESEKALT
jgi:hypothetical protein